MEKHKRKISAKVLSAILTVMMVVALTPAVMFNETENASAYSSSDVKWTDGVTGGAIYFDEYTGTITGCDESVSIIVIPEEISGVKVTSIGEEAFYDCMELKRIEIPASVTEIGDSAFSGCDNLILYVTKGSYAEEYCQDDGFLRYIAEKMPDTKEFIDISRCSVDNIDTQIYEGKDVTPEVNVKDGGKILTKNKDYILKYDNNWCRGTAKAIIYGAGSYEGIIEKEFQIKMPSITNAEELTDEQWALIYEQMGASADIEGKEFKDGECVPPAFIIWYLFQNGAFDRYATNDGYVVTTANLYALAEQYFLTYDKNALKEYMIEYVKHGENSYNETTDTFTFFMGFGGWVEYKLLSVEKTETSFILKGKLYKEDKYDKDMQFIIRNTSGGYRIVAYESTSTLITYSDTIQGGKIYFDQSTGTITGCDNSVTKAVIPNTIKGVKVTSIEPVAFYECTLLQSVKIPDSVTNIGQAAFGRCISLTSVDIPSSVIKLGGEALANCTSLTKVNLYCKIKWIDWATFAGCSKLQYINIPESVTNIGTCAFQDCTSLRNIKLTENIVDIGAEAFGGCNITIYGREGSYTESYAKENNIPFVINNEPVIDLPTVEPQKTVSANLYDYNDFKVSWSSQKVEGDTVKYKVEYKKYGGTWNVAFDKKTSTSVNVDNLTAGARYAFKVTPYVTIDGNNYYGASKSTSYIYTLKKLNKPVVKKSSKAYVKVSWNNINGESGYEIARSKYSSKNFSVVKRVSDKYKSATIKTTKNKKYYYKVRAYKTTKVNGKNVTVYAPWSSVKSYTLK